MRAQPDAQGMLPTNLAVFAESFALREQVPYEREGRSSVAVQAGYRKGAIESHPHAGGDHWAGDLRPPRQSK